MEYLTVWTAELTHLSVEFSAFLIDLPFYFLQPVVAACRLVHLMRLFPSRAAASDCSPCPGFIAIVVLEYVPRDLKGYFYRILSLMLGRISIFTEG